MRTERVAERQEDDGGEYDGDDIIESEREEFFPILVDV